MRKSLLCFLTVMLLISTASALRNPSAVYCEAMGYDYVVFSSPYGDVGKCVLPNGEAVDAWEFYRGETALEYSYCAKEGYEAKHVEREDCKSCLVCVLPDGREVEVAELMGLSFEETTCGDGVCGIPENYSSCPQDCHSGDEDGYCDAVEDGICDPDCLQGEDVDCTESEKVEESPAEITTTQPQRTPGFEAAAACLAVSATLLLLRRP